MLHHLFRCLACSVLLLANPLWAQEDCANGVDDDGDGLVDLNDADACLCDALPLATDSLIPNPTFEVFDCNPAFFDQFACANAWYTATLSTPDFFEYGNFWNPWIPQPGAGVGAVGGYVLEEDSEYPGTCLLGALSSGVEYTYRMHIIGRSNMSTSTPALVLPPVDITLWGSATCPTWPPGPISTCPGDFGWTALATIPYVPDTLWGSVTTTFVAPFAVQAIIIGAPCDPPPAYTVASGNQPYVIYDDLELFASNTFSGTLTRTGGWCTNDLVLHAASDTSAATFQWYRDGVALVGSTDSLLHLAEDSLGTGIYQVRITFGNRCLLRSITIVDDVLPVIQFTATPLTGCAPLSVAFTDQSTADTLSSVQWSFGDGDSSSTFSPVHQYTTPGTYSVSVHVEGSNGCSADSTAQDLVLVLPTPEADFTFGPQPTDIYTTEQHFVSTSSADVVAWAWTFASGTPANDTVPQPTVSFPAEEAGSYAVQLVVTNAFGCTDTAAALVVVNGSLSLYGPNAFTPNGDGVNDDWRPLWRDLDPRDYHLRIFDRWGEEVWTSTDALLGWDGSYKGQAPKNDVYAWKLEGRDTVDRRTLTVFGHVTVLR